MNKIYSKLPATCELQASIEVSDEMMYRGIPEEYIQRDLCHHLAEHLRKKASVMIQRSDRGQRRDPWDRSYNTRFTANVFVFTKDELEKFAKAIYEDGKMNAEHAAAKTISDASVKSTKAMLKKSLTVAIDRAVGE